MLLFLILLTSGQPISMERVSFTSSHGPTSINLTANGELLLSRGHTLAHWRSSGRLRQSFRLPEGSFITFPFFDTRTQVYWLPFSAETEAGQISALVFYDAHGTRLNQVNQWLRYIRFTNGRYLAPLKISDFDYIHKNRYTFQLQEITFKQSEGMGSIARKGMEFGKITPKQMRMGLNYKLVWPVAREDGYLLVNQLEPKIFLYGRSEIEKENLIKENRPWQASNLTLDLPGFIPSPERWVELNGTFKSAMVAFRRWQNSFSRITYFNRFRDGYALAYTVPQCQEYRADSEACDHVRIFLVKLDEALRLTEPPQQFAETEIIGTEMQIYSVTTNFDNDMAMPVMTPLTP